MTVTGKRRYFPWKNDGKIQTSLAVFMQEATIRICTPANRGNVSHALVILFLIVESDNDVQVLILCTSTKDR